MIGFNRYNAWYSNTGKLETIQSRVEEEAEKWFSKYNKPVFMAEYGADTIAGLHMVGSGCRYVLKYRWVRYRTSQRVTKKKNNE